MPPGEPQSFTVSTIIPAPADRVWSRITTIEGVNHELAPFIYMTSPRRLAGFTITDAPLGERAFRSLVLAFGLLPVDVHDLTLVAVDHGRGFHEHSTTLAQRDWVHIRELDPIGDTTRVTDSITFTPRAALLGPVLQPIIHALFRHRHRRLVRHFRPA